MTQEQMREAAQIKEELLKGLPDTRDRVRFFNHLVRFYGDTKTPQELLAMAVERDESQYFRPHGESVAAMYRRTEDTSDTTLCYCLRHREEIGSRNFIMVIALGSFLDRCRTQAEQAYYTSKTPDELLDIFRDEQVEIYGEEALDDPRWGPDGAGRRDR